MTESVPSLLEPPPRIPPERRIHSTRRDIISALKEAIPDYDPLIQLAREAIRLSELADAMEEGRADFTASDGSQITMQLGDGGALPAGSLIQARIAAAQAHDRVAQYVVPKLKAIDVAANQPINVVIDQLDLDL